MTAPQILDATAGSRMMWFDPGDERVIFLDKRHEQTELCDGRSLVIAPDVQADFTAMPFSGETFQVVVFDPPHLERVGDTSWTKAKYGALLPGWEDVIRSGFTECFRVLKSGGILIFKWSEVQIPISKVLPLAGAKPLFGHKTGKSQGTHWVTFIKEDE